MQEKKIKKYIGFIPPRNYAFKDTRQAMGYYICGLCSIECARFLRFVRDHPTKGDSNLARFLLRYELAGWASGKVPREVWVGKEYGARESLIAWALAMAELNSFFHQHNIKDPIGYLEKHSLISIHPDGYGWKANLSLIEQKLKIDLGMRLADK